MTRVRPYASDAKTDRLEEAWWNANAAVVEEVWAMPKRLRHCVRGYYLRQARKFFLGRTARRPVTVLEVGCGSGWVGRMLAHSGGMRIVGIDVSATQIELAKAHANEDGLAAVCEYRDASLADAALPGEDGTHCVLVHAILHHLSWSEIHAVLGQIAALGRGTRVFVYEPVNLDALPGRTSVAFRVCRRLACSVVESTRRASERFVAAWGGERHDALAQELASLQRVANENAWVLSPKELIFAERELDDVLRRYFRIERRVLCNALSLTVAQHAVLYPSEAVRAVYARVVVPLARAVDGALFRTGMLPFATRENVFLGYFCTVR